MGGGTQLFFLVGPDFQSVGLVNWSLPPKRGLVNWKYQNFGSCDLKISKFGVLWTKISIFWGLRENILAKIEVVEAKFSLFFSQMGVLWTGFCLKWNPCELRVAQMGPLRTTGEARKGSSGPHLPIPPFWVSAPLPRVLNTTLLTSIDHVNLFPLVCFLLLSNLLSCVILNVILKRQNKPKDYTRDILHIQMHSWILFVNDCSGCDPI